MKYISTLLIISLLLSLSYGQIVYGETENQQQETPELTLYSQSAALMDAQTGRILYGKQDDTLRPMASTTKIMTCIVALEYGNLSDVVTVSSYAASQPKVHLGIREGDQFYLKDLLYSLMLESHNDAAVAIAEHVGGSVEEFAELMNQKARDIGCKQTNFITPNGLDAEVTEGGIKKIHGTTAGELSKIMSYCVLLSPEKDEYMKITRTQNYSFSDVKKKKTFQCTNHNALLNMRDGVLSGKTGFTGGAGYSYVGAVKKDDRVFVIALLGCGWPPHKTYKWSDAKKLLDYGFESYEYHEVFQPQVFSPVPVINGVPQSGSLDDKAIVTCSMLLSQEESTLKVLLGKQEEVVVKCEIPDYLNAPVYKGQVIGSVTYWLNKEQIKSFPVYAEYEVKSRDYLWCIGQIAEKYFLTGGFAQK